MSARTYGLRTAPAVTRYRKLTFGILGRSVGGANPRPYDRSSTDHAPRVASVRRNPVDDALAYHDDRRMGAARPGNARHHRCIGHPQPLNALDPAVLVNDRHRIGIRSHLAGPGHVPGCAHGLPYPQVQSVVVGQNVIRRVDPVIDHVLIRIGLQQFRRQPQAFPHPSNVIWMLEITVVEGTAGRWDRPRPA